MEILKSYNNTVPDTPSEIEDSNIKQYDAFKLLGTKEVAAILKCNPETARVTMSRADFPLLKIGKNFKVSEQAFEKWLLERHV